MFGWPPKNIQLWACRILCHLLIHFMTCSCMITSIFGDLVNNEMEPPLISQTMRDLENIGHIIGHWCKHALSVLSVTNHSQTYPWGRWYLLIVIGHPPSISFSHNQIINHIRNNKSVPWIQIGINYQQT